MSHEETMLHTADQDRRLTVEDLWLLSEDGKRHELIDGVHFVTPSPSARHQRIVQRLYVALDAYLQERPSQGEAFVAPFDVVLSSHDLVEPDVLLIAGDQPEILTELNVQGPPALVVEVLSQGTRKRDEQTKRRLYERAGVREYWVIDPELDLVKVFRRGDDGTLPRVVELTLEARGLLTTPLLPEFMLPLERLLAR